ncbi:hypothetical protein GOP47_0002176, partial [Adiantum capillus-veneris]
RQLACRKAAICEREKAAQLLAHGENAASELQGRPGRGCCTRSRSRRCIGGVASEWVGQALLQKKEFVEQVRPKICGGQGNKVTWRSPCRAACRGELGLVCGGHREHQVLHASRRR